MENSSNLSTFYTLLISDIQKITEFWFVFGQTLCILKILPHATQVQSNSNPCTANSVAGISKDMDDLTSDSPFKKPIGNFSAIRL